MLSVSGIIMSIFIFSQLFATKKPN
jgi:hypothetical protein